MMINIIRFYKKILWYSALKNFIRNFYHRCSSTKVFSTNMPILELLKNAINRSKREKWNILLKDLNQDGRGYKKEESKN